MSEREGGGVLFQLLWDKIIFKRKENQCCGWTAFVPHTCQSHVAPP